MIMFIFYNYRLITQNSNALGLYLIHMVLYNRTLPSVTNCPSPSCWRNIKLEQCRLNVKAWQLARELNEWKTIFLFPRSSCSVTPLSCELAVAQLLSTDVVVCLWGDLETCRQSTHWGVVVFVLVSEVAVCVRVWDRKWESERCRVIELCWQISEVSDQRCGEENWPVFN